MPYEERRTRTDRMRAADAGVAIADSEAVAFLPRSGDAQIDESQIGVYYGEHFDIKQRTDEGVFMTRPKEAEAVITKRYQEASKAGCVPEKPKFGGREKMDEEDEEAESADAEPMMDNDPDTLKGHQFLTVDA